MITIAETPPFIKKAQKLLSSSERNELISYLSIHPKEGLIIEGSGGLRKLRWARGASGKSGGVRVILLLLQRLFATIFNCFICEK